MRCWAIYWGLNGPDRYNRPPGWIAPSVTQTCSRNTFIDYGWLGKCGFRREGIAKGVSLTADRGFLVLLKIIVDKSKDERRLE